MNTLRLNIDSFPWVACSGKWHFRLYMDYCLTIKVNPRSLSLHVRDLTREEDCRLILIAATAEYLLLRLESSWLHARLRFYPASGGRGLLIDFTDHDEYRKSDPLEVPRGHAVIVTPRWLESGKASFPDWIYGTWREENQGVWLDSFLQLEAVEGGALRFAQWWDAGMKPPTRSKRSYFRILDIIAVDIYGLSFVWQGYRELNRRREGRLFFDATRQRIVFEHTRRVAASREPLS